MKTPKSAGVSGERSGTTASRDAARQSDDGKTRTVPVCPSCGSDNVAADAAARWSVESGQWEVSNVLDKGHGCDDCGAEDFLFAWVTQERDEVPIPEICELLIASTAHVTAREAQRLTEQGYARGECGWFFHLEAEGEAVLGEIEPLSDGLLGVIRCACERGCQYVLLDRDANFVSGVTTYEW